MWHKYLMTVTGLLVFFFGQINITSAAVDNPRLSIQVQGGDTGASSSAGSLFLDATAISLITSSTPIDIADTDFNLTASFVSSTGNTLGAVTSYNNGTITIGGLLSATFNNLSIVNLGNSANFTADLVYTGGSIIGGLSGGRIEGALFNLSGDLSNDFTAANVLADLGPVAVPLPAAAWFFVPALLALFGFGTRRKA